jgi:N-acetylneuraminic acid mutarotase
VLLFGGSDGEHATDFKNDTWLFNGTDWNDLYRTPDGKSPEPRAISAMATFGKGAVLFGGMSGLQQWECLNDTWLWDLENGWSKLSLPHAPIGRAYHSMAETEFGVVLFGGRTFHLDTYSESFNDVWLFDGRSWTAIDLMPTAPRPRSRYGFAFSPTANGVLLFGGAGDSENDHFTDSWMLNINATDLNNSTW